MIPLQLTLKNFLSYRSANLDFQGLHTACICGANGAGKSSLLEAMTWAVWGQSRAGSDDDVINAGAQDVRVDFTFISNERTYRVIRSRPRGRSPSLEFQIQTESGMFRAITAKGVRATQEQIIACLKLDYDTFVNSAYLRQGRADEFMLRRPSDRKQILADLLKLDRYEEMAEKAKERSKEFKGQAEQLDLNLQPLKEALETRSQILAEQQSLGVQLAELQTRQQEEGKQLQALQDKERDRTSWQQQVTWQQNQYDDLTQECDRLVRDRDILQEQLAELQTLLQRDEEITAGYQEFVRLQQQEETLASKFQAYQDAQQQKQLLHQQIERQINEIHLQIRTAKTRLDTLEQQEKDLEAVLSRAPEVAQGIEQLRHHRQRLQQLDRLQLEVSPLLQRRSEILIEVDRAQAQLSARLEQLQARSREFSTQMQQVPHLRKELLEVNATVQELDKKKVYRDRINEKGQARNAEIERLQESQRAYEKQIAELQQKLALLESPNAVCPLCDRPLDEHHHARVVQKTQTQQEQLHQQIWQIREQFIACERERQHLRGEYRQLTEELERHDPLLQKQGQLEADIERTFEIHERLQEIQQEQEQLERSLAAGHYALDLQAERQSLEEQLQRLNYDEQTHALIREEERRWRWAEIKQAKIDDAGRDRAQLQTQKPQLQAQLAQLQTDLERVRLDSELQQEIVRVEESIAQLGYDRAQHNEIVIALRQGQAWQLHYQNLKQAKAQLPQQQTRLAELEQRLNARLADREEMKKRLDSTIAQMSSMTDHSADIRRIEAQMQQRRRQMDEALAHQGRVQQQLAQLEVMQSQHEQTQEQLQTARRQYRVYQELTKAFGKNGIQALMIENILPQLEAQTNQILARLTGNQLHVQFVTQKAGKGRSKRKAKTIDTLEILIADARGTRPYETYSGGEAFRINFAIRLALARLLAQRAGASMQMLIVDEGFGTQDAEGCDRLIAAINAIASDFSCILTVTHMPQFKEAFQTRIEVRKTQEGSQLHLLN